MRIYFHLPIRTTRCCTFVNIIVSRLLIKKINIHCPLFKKYLQYVRTTFAVGFIVITVVMYTTETCLKIVI